MWEMELPGVLGTHCPSVVGTMRAVPLCDHLAFLPLLSPACSSWSYWLDWSQTWFSPSAASPCDRDVALSLCPVLARVPCWEWGSVLWGDTGDRLGRAM